MMTFRNDGVALTFKLSDVERLEVRVQLQMQEPQRSDVLSLLDALNTAGQVWEKMHEKKDTKD